MAYYTSEPKRHLQVPISVLVCAKNESKNLSKLIPSIISQNYIDFEVVLINDRSSDNTLEVMEEAARIHKNIKIVDVHQNERFVWNKKYALTLGIKAAKYDYLLLTDADCKIISSDWISSMTENFTSKKSIVLGYSGYKKIKHSFLNKLVRFETLYTAIQYISYAILGEPYMGVGRNLAYQKSLFFNHNGFSSHMQIKSGDDDLFVNQVANGWNTSVCLKEESFTISEPKKSFGSWIYQKRRHVSTAKHYRNSHKIRLGLFYLSQALFYLLSIILLLIGIKFEIVISLIILRFLIQLFIVSKSAKKLGENDLIVFIPLLELSLIAIQFYIFISNLVSKPKNWS